MNINGETFAVAITFGFCHCQTGQRGRAILLEAGPQILTEILTEPERNQSINDAILRMTSATGVLIGDDPARVYCPKCRKSNQSGRQALLTGCTGCTNCGLYSQSGHYVTNKYAQKACGPCANLENVRRRLARISANYTRRLCRFCGRETQRVPRSEHHSSGYDLCGHCGR